MSECLLIYSGSKYYAMCFVGSFYITDEMSKT